VRSWIILPAFVGNLLLMAEKGGSRTLRGPYDPQTGFEDQRHHRAPSFSDSVFNYLRDALLFCLPIHLSICDVPKVFATSAAWRSTYRGCICTLLWPLAFHRHVYGNAGLYRRYTAANTVRVGKVSVTE
jgi:hypothetical protein